MACLIAWCGAELIDFYQHSLVGVVFVICANDTDELSCVLVFID